MMTPDGENDVVVLDELGVAVGVMPGEEGLSVLMLLPGAAEPEVEVKRGDLVLMIDGKRVRDVAALREAYEAAGIGNTVKVGFRRGDQRFLAAFERREAEGHGGERMVMIGATGTGAGEMEPLIEFGVLLAEQDGRVVVAMEMPMDEVSLAKDDVIRSVNGTDVTTLEGFREAYSALDVGAQIDLVVSRGDAEISATRDKSERRGQVRMRSGP